jgi:hypothetical protein
MYAKSSLDFEGAEDANSPMARGCISGEHITPTATASINRRYFAPLSAFGEQGDI